MIIINDGFDSGGHIMKRKGLVASAVLAALLMPGSASAAVLDGAAINASWRFPSIGSLYTNYGNSVVGAGAEYSNLNVDGAIFFDVDVADTSITVDFLQSFSAFNLGSFNGLYITDLGNAFPALSVVSVVVNGFTFLASDVIFDSGGFGLDFQGDAFVGGESVTVNFAAPVPLPAALPLLLVALGGLGALRSRRKAG